MLKDRASETPRKQRDRRSPRHPTSPSCDRALSQSPHRHWTPLYSSAPATRSLSQKVKA
ncbi:hypothetical protein [Leptolyngbya sp. PCC 6406]|uniref:hypothetical protein n=1 Tax=Leptolyngbya sp. PCC 6406 TaxID=1173264 RepID=UPI0002E71E46|nr:hypothetical protein [Leptolyngbya sp. PCC 6406]